jgi:hypothetical protein
MRIKIQIDGEAREIREALQGLSLVDTDGSVLRTPKEAVQTEIGMTTSEMLELQRQERLVRASRASRLEV